MTHYKLNRMILGVAAVYSIVIIAAIFFGPTSSDKPTDDLEYTPGFTESVSGTPTPHTGVGGVPEEETVVTGTIIDGETGDPIAGVSISAENAEAEETITTTGADGRFEVRDVFDPVTVTFSVDGYATIQQELEPAEDYTIEMSPPVLSGRVSSIDGSPIRGAMVAAGDVFTHSVESGVFHLEGAPEDASIVVKAAGYETEVIPQAEFDSGFMLEPTTMQAIYAPADAIANEERFARYLELIEQTDLNGLVIDLKDHLGRVHYDSGVGLANEIEAVESTFDVEAVLSELDQRGIYAIARIVTFEDPHLAEARPDLAIGDSLSDDLWRTWQGRAWANPFEDEVWEYNIALMEEAAALGFDEVQLSSVQFPESGLVNRADYGISSTATRRHQAIADFLDHAYAAIAPTETRLTAEIFAMSLWDESNDITGQDLTTMAERVDYLHPLLFPSHFPSGSLGFNTPGNHPDAMVGRSLESGNDLLPRHLVPKLRPWLQDFSYGSAMPFGEGHVRRQIDAANTFGATGWMLWNPDGEYHEGALYPTE